MVKSVVKAMDAIQTNVRSVEDFLLIGASKRGWTTWLTSAIDPRVKAMVSIVIDIPNFGEQANNHWESYGFYTQAIKDYIDFNIFCRFYDTEGEDLLTIVDPFSYFDKCSMPKLLINGANDDFFVPDAAKFSINDLPGPSYLRYIPNSGHHLEAVLEDHTPILSLLSFGYIAMKNRK